MIFSYIISLATLMLKDAKECITLCLRACIKSDNSKNYCKVLVGTAFMQNKLRPITISSQSSTSTQSFHV